MSLYGVVLGGHVQYELTDEVPTSIFFVMQPNSEV
jgi:hypothetical protein